MHCGGDCGKRLERGTSWSENPVILAPEHNVSNNMLTEEHPGGWGSGGNKEHVIGTTVPEDLPELDSCKGRQNFGDLAKEIPEQNAENMV